MGLLCKARICADFYSDYEKFNDLLPERTFRHFAIHIMRFAHCFISSREN